MRGICRSAPRALLIELQQLGEQLIIGDVLGQPVLRAHLPVQLLMHPHREEGRKEILRTSIFPPPGHPSRPRGLPLRAKTLLGKTVPALQKTLR